MTSDVPKRTVTAAVQVAIRVVFVAVMVNPRAALPHADERTEVDSVSSGTSPWLRKYTTANTSKMTALAPLAAASSQLTLASSSPNPQNARTRSERPRAPGSCVG